MRGGYAHIHGEADRITDTTIREAVTPAAGQMTAKEADLAAKWDDDAIRLRILDDGLTEARRLAGEGCACRPGCFGCCLGPFPITMHDAARLRRGLAAMEELEPARAARMRERASEAMEGMRDGFPGDWPSGALDPARADGELYARRYEMIPCPALQLETGECELYDSRPVACRTFGLAVRVGSVDLHPCRLNYAGLANEEIERRRVELDVRPGAAADPEAGQTVVAAVLRLES